MALPTKIYLDDNEFIIYQHNFSGGYRTKAITDEMTITGKRSRQFAFNPREFQFTVWLTPDYKNKLESLWYDDGAGISAVHYLKVGEGSSYSYSVTFDSYELKPHPAVEERYLADITLKEWV
mgnify:CR=1 FL=1